MVVFVFIRTLFGTVILTAKMKINALHILLLTCICHICNKDKKCKRPSQVSLYMENIKWVDVIYIMGKRLPHFG